MKPIWAHPPDLISAQTIHSICWNKNAKHLQTLSNNCSFYGIKPMYSVQILQLTKEFLLQKSILSYMYKTMNNCHRSGSVFAPYLTKLYQRCYKYGTRYVLANRSGFSLLLYLNKKMRWTPSGSGHEWLIHKLGYLLRNRS